MNQCGRIDNSHAEVSQIIIGDTPHSRKWRITPHSFSVGCAQWLLSKGHRVERTQRITFQQRNLTSIVLVRWRKQTWQCYSESMRSWHHGMKEVFLLSSSSDMYLQSKQWGKGPSIEGHFKSIWTILQKMLRLSKTTRFWETITA